MKVKQPKIFEIYRTEYTTLPFEILNIPIEIIIEANKRLEKPIEQVRAEIKANEKSMEQVLKEIEMREKPMKQVLKEIREKEQVREPMKQTEYYKMVL